jgi:O-antigen/teichoic acid export membrane protein
MTGALGKKFSQGVAWLYVLRLISRLISSFRVVLVARFLSPEDFGVMGVALLVLSLLNMLATTGYNQALVQKKADIRGYLDTAWVVSVARGLMLGVIIYLGASIASTFFQEPRSVSVLRVMAFSPIIMGFASPGLVKLNKDLHFKKLVLFEATRSFLGATVTVVLAILLRSVWALVAASLFGNLVYSFGSYLVHPYRPGLNFGWKQARELWNFGRWILGNRILHYLFNDGDDWLVGRLLGAQALGFYQTAYRLGCAPTTEITSVFSQVALPTFSKLQDNVGKSRKAYLRILQVVMFASTPVALGVLLVARDGVVVFLGQNWLPMVVSLQILVCWGWLRSFRATTGPILLAQGRPDLVLRFTVFKVVVLAGLIVPFSLRWGIVGTSGAVVTAAFLEMPLLLHGLNSALSLKYLDIVRRLVRPFLAGIPMSLVILFEQEMLPTGALRLGITVLSGAFVYLLIIYILDRKLHWDLMRDLEQALGHNVRPIIAAARTFISRKFALKGG